MADTRPDCGGIYGSATYGQRYYAAHIQCGSPETRPNCGGIYGTGTYGQRYYAGHTQCVPPIPVERPDCGGMWGTGAWGMRYYAGHVQCGYVPPPVPPSPGRQARGYANGRKPLRKDEELEELLFLIMLWNALPRPSASLDPKEEPSG